MTSSKQYIYDFLEGPGKRFVIPVYQRKYNWKRENCLQLLSDLESIITDNRESHFIGSFVVNGRAVGRRWEMVIIDGQQRLTTISLIYLAIRNMIREGIVPDEGRLPEQIDTRFLLDPYSPERQNEIKLRLIGDDFVALQRLFENPDNYIADSNITEIYKLIYNHILSHIQNHQFTIGQFWDAMNKLVIVNISLEGEDDPQLIFESINSTGLDLSDGDKIRNFILMNLTIDEQARLYDDYWIRIEENTNNDVSSFIRYYLIAKGQPLRDKSDVYYAFKTYFRRNNTGTENLLADVLRYARLYRIFLTSSSCLNNPELDNLLYRLKRLGYDSVAPFLMEVFHFNQDHIISNEDVYEICCILESYIFRRSICTTTQSLNKTFYNLNKDVLALDETPEDYKNKFVYVLLNKRNNNERFPDDETFKAELSIRDIYSMSSKNKAYIFERYENYGTRETRDIYSRLDSKVYSIEHIMPQSLSPIWRENLGPNCLEIHKTWLNKLANLTLTAYNSNLSNSPFSEKRDAPEYGYRNSGLRMNQIISQKDSWGEQELREREANMLDKAIEIWKYPETQYHPVEADFYTLDDQIDFTGRRLEKYRYQGEEEETAGVWSRMFVSMIKIFYHQSQTGFIEKIRYNPESQFSRSIRIGDSTGLRQYEEIDSDIFVDTNNTTTSKIAILRSMFGLFEADPNDLVFYLRNEE